MYARTDPPLLGSVYGKYPGRSCGGAGRGGWRRCSSVTDFWRICTLVAPCQPPRQTRNPLPDLFSKQALTTVCCLFVETWLRRQGWIAVRENNQPKVSTHSKSFFSQN